MSLLRVNETSFKDLQGTKTPGQLPVKSNRPLQTLQGPGQKTWAPLQTTSCLPHSGTRHLTPRLRNNQAALLLLLAGDAGPRGILGQPGAGRPFPLSPQP